MGYHEWKSCIDACLECAAICYTAAQLMALGSIRAKELCRLCAGAFNQVFDTYAGLFLLKKAPKSILCV
jgi:hypothetical protein